MLHMAFGLVFPHKCGDERAIAITASTAFRSTAFS